MDGRDNDAAPGVSNYDVLLRRLPSINLTPAADSQVFPFFYGRSLKVASPGGKYLRDSISLATAERREESFTGSLLLGELEEI